MASKESTATLPHNATVSDVATLASCSPMLALDVKPNLTFLTNIDASTMLEGLLIGS